MLYTVTYFVNNKEVSEKEWSNAFDAGNPGDILTKQYVPVYNTLNLRTTESYGEADRINLLLTNDPLTNNDSYVLGHF